MAGIEDDLDVRVQPWDQMSAESDVAYGYFRVYRDMGRTRSLSKVTDQFDDVKTGSLSQLSSKYQWVARCQAFDATLDAIEDAEFMAARRQIGRQSAKVASAAVVAAQHMLAASVNSMLKFSQPTKDADGNDVPVQILDPTEALRSGRVALQLSIDAQRLVGLDRANRLDVALFGGHPAASDAADEFDHGGVDDVGVGMSVMDLASTLLALGSAEGTPMPTPAPATAGADDGVLEATATDPDDDDDLDDVDTDPTPTPVEEPPPVRGGPRLIVAGVPSSGKTTFAGSFTTAVLHTDDLARAHGWAAVPEKACEWLAQPGPWVIEGVSIPKVLKRWLETNPEGAPCDQLWWLADPFTAPTEAEASTGRAAQSMFDGLVEALVERGVVVHYGITS